MSSFRNALVGLGTIGLAQAIHIAPAHADLMKLEHWTPTYNGALLSPSTFLPGDFDGNGKTDLAYVWIACQDCYSPFNPYGPVDAIGIDLHMSCDNRGIACPSGAPSPGASGAFVMEHTIAYFNPALPWGNDLDECGTNFSCDIVTGQKVKWLAGDFDGDGKTDLAFAYAKGGGLNIWVALNPGAGNPTFVFTPWALPQGGWVVPSDFVVGDFNGDGKDDIAYVFDDPNDYKIDIDVHASTGSSFVNSRWATNLGDWEDPGKFVASDFNGDGLTDVGFAMDDGGGMSFDVYLSTNGSFYKERWATREGAWLTGQVMSVSGTLHRHDKEQGVSLIPQAYTPNAPGWGLGGSGLGDFVYAFDDGGQISIDGHLANTSWISYPNHGELNSLRYATHQGLYLSPMQFVAGDFNGDLVGDVADAFQCGGTNNICIDVHAGTCSGPIANNGQCCAAESNICDGACCWGTCSNSPAAVNGCCQYGQYCPPPPPPPIQ